MSDRFAGFGQPVEVVGGSAEQTAAVATLFSRPFKRRAGTGFLQEAQAGGRAGFQCATNPATVAGLTDGGLGRCAMMEMDNLLVHKHILNLDTQNGSKCSNNFKERPMIKLISAVVAVVFALGSVSAFACGDKAKDEKQMSTPSKPKV